ncbi:endonuclease domain-containing protein [Geodermatophilus sp. SYSU D00525]
MRRWLCCCLPARSWAAARQRGGTASVARAGRPRHRAAARRPRVDGSPRGAGAPERGRSGRGRGARRCPAQHCPAHVLGRRRVGTAGDRGRRPGRDGQGGLRLPRGPVGHRARRLGTVGCDPGAPGGVPGRPAGRVGSGVPRAGGARDGPASCPEPQVEVRHAGRFVARVDLAFPEARLAVEYEGEHHVGGVQIVRDDERRARLRAAGWRVIRLSAADLRALDAAVRRVLAALTATRAAGTAIPAARGQGSGQAPRAAPTTARASSCTCARWSGPLNDSA